MKQYNILHGSDDHYYISEGKANSGSIFDDSRRRSFDSEEGLIGYIRSNTNTRKKTQFNLDNSVESGLEGEITKINSKAIFQKMDLRKA